ncbi:Putative 115 kDa protein in type-1 retrotransposable element R1DM [Eumeta japonica]|uniref:115 kDa protein in type-1 retrotransposable element R1DM n=1 Tax=Eumeta variegata TaxID=151549 RepID=A0A4C2A1F4_EUMVA|nr:Putative 115 kDa protein in type-1 retrotransposable element R1DM [Eumeta japonica]
MGTPPKVSVGKGRGASPLPQTCAKPLECHPVLEVSPALYTRLIKPATCMWGCSGDRFGTSRLWCSARAVLVSAIVRNGAENKMTSARTVERSYRSHVSRPQSCSTPKCINCTRAGCGTSPIRHLARMRRPRQMGRYSADKGRVLLAAGASAAQNRTHMADGLSVGSEADHASLRFIQSNLQRSKLATAELLVGASRRKIAVALVQEPYVGNTGELKRYSGCRVIQRVARVPDPHGRELQNWRRVGLLRVRQADRPIPRPREVGLLEARDEQNHPGGDVNAWSVWWGSERDDAGNRTLRLPRRGGLHVLNRRNIPRSKYTGDRLLRSTVDVTACSSALLDRAEEWQVVRAKARWSEFLTAFDNAKEERALTAGTVEVVDSCDRLDRSWICTPNASSTRATLPYRESARCETEAPLVESRTRGAERDANTKSVASKRSLADAGMWSRNMESVWDGIYRVIRNTGRNREDVLLINDSGQTCSPNESAVLLANTFFPDDRVDTDGPYHTELRRRTDGSIRPPEASDILSEMDPPFTGAEVKMALKAFNPKKAPGIDGFTSDICQAAILRDLGLFLAMANKCLQLGYFPRAWKVATIKVIPKPGKDDYSRPKSYRPIGLLPVMGKTVERMLVWRIQWHIMPKLQTRQYGFMPQRGTEDSLYDLMTHIHNELNLKRIIVMVSLDIEGAFDNAWWPALRNQLLVHKCQ